VECVTRKILAYATFATVALTLVAGCKSGDDTTTAAPAASSTAPTVAPSTATPTEAAPTSAAPTEAAPTSAAPTESAPKPQKLKTGAKGAKVTALQERLADLGYWNGKADGSFGSLTHQAVYAVQKTAGLTRDGVVGPKTQKAIDDGVRPKAKSTKGHLVEINLKRQLLMIVDDGKVTTVFNTATGSNQHYVYEGNTYLAVTPKGHFTVGRQIDGQRDGPLGPLWRPKYFNGGIAMHGAASIPPYPASHGCARLTNAAINWIWANDKVPLKTKVWVY
jgi:peptidoglycan hydrolase-like protein with peptidoglycan-binding domain